jgi:methyl-accepting chemotaxis protein
MKWAPIFRFRYAGKLFTSHLIAVFLVSGSVGTFFYVRAMDNLMRSLRSRLQNSAALLSQSVDARTLDGIRSPADVNQSAYTETLAKMRRVRRTNPDIAYLYLMRKEGDEVHFVLDTDETEAQAMPGQVYDEATPLLRAGFVEPSVDDELVEDEWGVFLSGYAPLLHGDGRYLVGLDMRANEVRDKLAELRMTGLVSLFASTLLALLFALFLSRGLTRRIDTMSRQCRELAAGRYDVRIEGRAFDEFDDLAEAFNTMAEMLGRTRRELERTVQELRDSRDSLEERVGQRTEELQLMLKKMNVLSGLLPICSSCKKIRDDQGYWKQVEHFVAEHSQAQFTHGVCPECLHKLYGKILKE